MFSDSDLDEIVFQVILTRMNGKKQYRKEVTEETMTSLCQAAQRAFESEPTVLRLASNIAIVGDIHGNIDDLLRIFERLRYPPSTRYLFLGDYVDRGLYGTEVVMLLFAMKLKYPEHIFLVRGNHESEGLTRVYGFQKEISTKFNEAVWRSVIDAFSALPLCAIVGERVFCVHGGLSPFLNTAADVESVAKPKDIPFSGLLADMVWSDPCTKIEGFYPSPRGCGCLYGPLALAEFLRANNFDLLVRSHSLCMKGTTWPFEDYPEVAEKCLTVFSTSNYCDQGNTAAVLSVSADLLVNVEEFACAASGEQARKHVRLPYWLSEMIAQKEQASKKARKANAKAKGHANGKECPDENTGNLSLIGEEPQ
jgi:diadenosine tetraphosphatase ApaH/serine/threonine PP2A family protein phosphatase